MASKQKSAVGQNKAGQQARGFVVKELDRLFGRGLAEQSAVGHLLQLSMVGKQESKSKESD